MQIVGHLKDKLNIGYKFQLKSERNSVRRLQTHFPRVQIFAAFGEVRRTFSNLGLKAPNPLGRMHEQFSSQELLRAISRLGSGRKQRERDTAARGKYLINIELTMLEYR